MDIKLIVKTLSENTAYIFCLPTLEIVDNQQIDTFYNQVSEYVQREFPNRNYNYFNERNNDMLCLVVVLDINNIESKEIQI